MFQLFYPLIQALQPILVPVCSVTAWSMVILLLWTVCTSARDGINKVKSLHQIPCVNCQFFTGDYHLKCTVNQTYALTEEAINCPDFRSYNRYNQLK